MPRYRQNLDIVSIGEFVDHVTGAKAPGIGSVKKTDLFDAKVCSNIDQIAFICLARRNDANEPWKILFGGEHRCIGAVRNDRDFITRCDLGDFHRGAAATSAG